MGYSRQISTCTLVGQLLSFVCNTILLLTSMSTT